MQRRTYIQGVTAVVAAGSSAGCVGDTEDDAGPRDGTDDDGNDDPDGSGESDGSDDTQYGTLSTSITDQPNDIGDFEELVVTIDGLWIKPTNTGDRDDGTEETPEEADDGEETGTNGDEAEDGEDGATSETETSTPDPEGENDEDEDEPEDGSGNEDEDGPEDEPEDEPEAEGEDEPEDDTRDGQGRYYIEFDESQDADLVELQGGNTQIVDETAVEAGAYQFIQLNVADTTGVLTSGEQATVETPGNAPLQFHHAFEIRADERTRFIADFAPHRTGHGKYLIRPVATGTTVLYGDEEYDPGTESDETDVETEPGDGNGTGNDSETGGRPEDAGNGAGGSSGDDGGDDGEDDTDGEDGGEDDTGGEDGDGDDPDGTDADE